MVERAGVDSTMMVYPTAGEEGRKPLSSGACFDTCPEMSPGGHDPQRELERGRKRRQHGHQERREEEEAVKRRHGHEEMVEEPQPLLPGLPDDLAQVCLARLPPRVLFSVCRSWRRFLYSSSSNSFLSLYALLSKDFSSSSIDIQTFDPIAGTWRPLPHHPHLQNLVLRHPSFLSCSLPVQSVAVAGRLVILAGTTHALLPALSQPLVFHPISSRWTLGPPLSVPRRWCATGATEGSVYVASGVGRSYRADVARSVERWNTATGAGFTGSGRKTCVEEEDGWMKVAPLWDGRFSREAVELVASQGKLCMVNVKGKAAKDGAVYDLARDRWESMPPGLIAGWTGPAAAVPSKAGGGSTIYVVDEVEGELRAYNWRGDSWATVVRSERLRGAAQMAVGGGRVCITSNRGDEVVVVDVARRPGRMWTIAPPDGRRVEALHVLPRMCGPDHHV